MKNIMRIGWKSALMLVSLTFFFTVGVIGFPKANAAEGVNRLKLTAIMKKVKEQRVKQTPNEYGIVQILGDVMSVAVIGEGDDEMCEAFIKVSNKEQIGDEYIVCLGPVQFTEVFSLAFSKGMPLHVFAIKFFKPEEYNGLPVAGYITAGARIVRFDVPPYLANMEMPYSLM